MMPYPSSKTSIRALAATTLLGFGMGACMAISDDAVITCDPKLPDYQKVEGVAGNVSSVGSDTLNNLNTFWAEEFRKLYPNVNIQIEGKGSSTAPPALISSTAQLGPMSRPMKKEEINEFEGAHGFKPLQISVALDSLAVFVHKDNPVKALTLQQVDGIFSKTRKLGGTDITSWGQAGVTEAAWSTTPISIFGRNSASGTYGFFKENVLGKGDYKDTVKEQPGSASVVMGITEDKGGIGYSGIGYKTSGVRALPLAGKDGQPFAPTYENVLNGKYPVSRALYIYIAKKPGKPLDPVVKEYLRLVLSKKGQEIVVKDGFYPLNADMVAKELAKLE